MIYTLKEWKQRRNPKVVINQPDFASSEILSDTLSSMLRDERDNQRKRYETFVEKLNHGGFEAELISVPNFFKNVSF